jgi:hypothetical protein
MRKPETPGPTESMPVVFSAWSVMGSPPCVEILLSGGRNVEPAVARAYL